MYNPVLPLNFVAERGFHQGSSTSDYVRIKSTCQRFLFDVTLFGVVQMSSCVSELLSNHQALNSIGGHRMPNANLPYKWRTFDRADCGVMSTNQARRDAHSTAECQYLSVASSARCWWKKKSNITHAASETRPSRSHSCATRNDWWELNKY